MRPLGTEIGFPIVLKLFSVQYIFRGVCAVDPDTT